jgi:hypothetical protein
VLNNCSLSAILARSADHYLNIKDSPPWVLFFNIAGYDYLPEERVKYQITDMLSSPKVVGTGKRIGSVSANEISQLVHRPSEEPTGSPFKELTRHILLTIYDKLPELIGVMMIQLIKLVIQHQILVFIFSP